MGAVCYNSVSIYQHNWLRRNKLKSTSAILPEICCRHNAWSNCHWAGWSDPSVKGCTTIVRWSHGPRKNLGRTEIKGFVLINLQSLIYVILLYCVRSNDIGGCRIGRVEKSKNGFGWNGYCFLNVFWYVENGGNFFSFFFSFDRWNFTWTFGWLH